MYRMEKIYSVSGLFLIIFAGFILANHSLAAQQIRCGAGSNICSSDYTPPVSIPLRAQSEPTYIFYGWTGRDAGNCDSSLYPDLDPNPNCNVVISNEEAGKTLEITALFDTRPKLDVTVSGSGKVTDGKNLNCQPNCFATYNLGAEVSLVAQPSDSEKYVFAGWSGTSSGECQSSTNPTCVLKMDYPSKSLTATFVEASKSVNLTVEVSKPQGGKVLGGKVLGQQIINDINCGLGSFACFKTYISRTAVTLKALPKDSNWRFAGWEGDCGGAGDCALSSSFMIKDRSVTANFEEIVNLKNISLKIVGSGTVTGPPSGGQTGFYCDRSSCLVSYPSSFGTVTLTANEIAGWVFSGWTGPGAGSCGINPSCQITLDGDKDLTANFVSANTLKTVGVNVDGPGTVTGLRINCPGTCDASYLPSESTVTLTAAVNNSTFNGWSGTGIACGQSLTCVLNLGASSRSVYDITARFTAKNTDRTIALSITGRGRVTGLNGRVDCSPQSSSGCQANVSLAELQTLGGKISLTAIPELGGSVKSWLVDGTAACGTNTTCPIDMSENRFVEVSFTTPTARTLSISKAGSGSVTGPDLNCPAVSSDCSVAYYGVNQVSISAAPSNGWQFSNWSDDASSCGSNPNNCPVSLSKLQTIASATFVPAASLKNLKVSIVGQGTVSDGANKINCVSSAQGLTPGSVCQADYPANDLVTLDAMQPLTGWTFVSWSGAGTETICGKQRFCPISINEAKQVTATFKEVIDLVQLTTVLDQSGTGGGTIVGDNLNCPPNCEALYQRNTSISINAVPDQTSVFSRWSGDLGLSPGSLDSGGALGACPTANCDLIMSYPRLVFAKFDKKPLLLVKIYGLGNVVSNEVPPKISCGINCSEYYFSGSAVKLEAKPIAPQAFITWGGACGTQNVPICDLTLDKDKVVEAHFTAPVNINTLNVGRVPENGTVGMKVLNQTYYCPPDCTKQLAKDADVTLSATADPNWRFTGWSGDIGTCTGVLPCVIKMDRERSVTASFDGSQATKNLSVSTSGNGSVRSVRNADIDCGNLCTKSYNLGMEVELQATPGVGSTFTGWSGTVGSCAGRTDRCILKLDNNLTTDNIVSVVATFSETKDLKQLTVTRPANGTVSGPNNSINCGAGGSLCSASYNSGDKITLNAFPALGYQVTGWTGVGTENCSGFSCALTMSENRQVAVSFSAVSNLRTLQINVVGQGTVTCPGNVACALSYRLGETVTLTAAPSAANYRFAGWTGRGTEACGGANTCAITFNENVSVTATFVLISSSQTLIISSPIGGKISLTLPSGGLTYCPPNCQRTFLGTSAKVVLKALADTENGWNFDGWTGNVDECAGQTGECTLLMDQPRVVSANFIREQPALIIQVMNVRGGIGSVSVVKPDPLDCSSGCADLRYLKNTQVLIRAAAGEGSRFTRWSGCDSNPVPTECQLTMDKSRRVEAGFEVPLPKVFDIFRPDVLRELNPLKFIPTITDKFKIFRKSTEEKK
ncbi:MAG: InlB B-repeat-containing protein [Candidatus Harrisonbacteria bacterium]|nr:InlB B-repeat-containing protein [Candidatus Harrisonbacteria bacterium]